MSDLGPECHHTPEDWDEGEFCDKCLQHPDNPHRFVFQEGAREVMLAKFDKWAAPEGTVG